MVNPTVQPIPGDLLHIISLRFPVRILQTSSKCVATATFREILYYTINKHRIIHIFCYSEKCLDHPTAHSRSCFCTAKSRSGRIRDSAPAGAAKSAFFRVWRRIHHARGVEGDGIHTPDTKVFHGISILVPKMSRFSSTEKVEIFGTMSPGMVR